MNSRNPVFPWDQGPPVAVQPRLTGTQQTGRLVIIDNPISYVVEPGRYFPFLSLRGHTDPVSRDLSDRLILGDVVGEQLPDNREPHYNTAGGYRRHLSTESTRGAAPRNYRPLANTTLSGTGPLGSADMAPSDPADFFSGIPMEPGRIGL